MKLLRLVHLFFMITVTGAMLNTAQAKESFRLAWSLYPAYMPWAYASSSGIIDKWADKYGIEIEIVQVNDYVEAINQYTLGAFDACTMATMDALTIPAAGGVDSSSIAIMDYSNGNDVIILKEGQSLEDLRGKRVNLIEYSISHYFLAKALDRVGMSERDMTLVNTSDADMVGLYAQPSVDAVVTWNPMASEILEGGNATDVFNSRQMPAELTDSIIVNTETLEQNPALGKALIGAWFETLAIMRRDDAQGREARKVMAQAAGTDLESYDKQLEDTFLYYEPSDVLALMEGSDLPDSMASIATFSKAFRG